MSDVPSDFGLFERLSTSMDDPYVDRIMEQAREAAELLNETDCSKEERAALEASLDRAWIYKNKTLVVSGVLWWVSPGKKIPKRSTVTDIHVLSDGFIFDPERFEVGDEYIEGKRYPSFALKIDTGRDDGLYSYAAMHFDDIEHIDYPFPSPELRSQRFRYHYPRHAEDIDYAVFNSRDTSEMISDLSVAVEFEGDGDDEVDLDAITDLQSYLDDTMDLDKQLPYRFSIVGNVAVMSDEKSAVISVLVQPLRRLGVVLQVRMLPDNLSDDLSAGKQRYVPYLEMMLYDDQRDVEPRRLMVPFSSIISASSVREEE